MYPALQKLTQKQTLGAVALILVVLVGSIALWTLGRDRLPDFRVYAAGEERKTAFFDYLAPIIEASNAEILTSRQRLLALEPAAIGARDERWMRRLAGHYDVEHGSMTNEELHATLLKRVDVVPEALGLAQAAKESGWGTSRFAREGNNLFGEWCFDKGCGIVPENRAPGRSHEVREFASPKKSIDSYLRNLNSHPAYRDFRTLRQQLRQGDRPLSAQELAAGLSQYSERGEAYVAEVRNLIRGNELE